MNNLRKRLAEAGIINQEGEYTPIKRESGSGLIIQDTFQAEQGNFENQKLQIMQRTGYTTFLKISEESNMLGRESSSKGTIMFNQVNEEVYVGDEKIEDFEVKKAKCFIIIEELEEDEYGEGNNLQEVNDNGKEQGMRMASEIKKDQYEAEQLLLEGPLGFEMSLTEGLLQSSPKHINKKDCLVEEESGM